MTKYKEPLDLHIKKGALKKQMMNKYGKVAFTNKGTIKPEYLKKAKAQGGTLGARANLALNMRGWKKR